MITINFVEIPTADFHDISFSDASNRKKGYTRTKQWNINIINLFILCIKQYFIINIFT